MRLIITSILVLISVMGISQTARDLVREGNKDYKIDSLNRAISTYENALNQDPLLEEAKFNLGDAFYKSGKFADAAKTFNQLAQTSERKELKSDAYYNEGNSLMQTQEFEKAMGSYKNSMIANPQNSKARYNYEYARKMMQEQQKQEQENEDQKDDKDKDDKDKKDDKKDEDEDSDKDKDKEKEENKDQDKDSDKNKDSDKDKEDEKKDGDKDKDEGDKGDEKKDKGKPDEQDGKDEKKEPQPQPGQMSKADAERLLKAMEDNEKKTRAKVAKMKAKSSKTKKSDKDW